MAFPVIESFTDSGQTSGTTFTVDYDSTSNSGELLICHAACDGSGDTLSWPVGTDWVTNEAYNDNNNHGWTLSWIEADGTEGGGSFDMGVSSSEGCSATVIRISGWDSGTAPEFSYTEFSTDDWESVTLNPLGWGTEDTLWIWTASWDGGDKSVSGWPAEMTDNRLNRTFSTVSGVAGLATATLNSAAASVTTTENTGVLSSSAGTAQGLIAVRPAAAAPTAGMVQPNRLNRVLMKNLLGR